MRDKEKDIAKIVGFINLARQYLIEGQYEVENLYRHPDIQMLYI